MICKSEIIYINACLNLQFNIYGISCIDLIDLTDKKYEYKYATNNCNIYEIIFFLKYFNEYNNYIPNSLYEIKTLNNILHLSFIQYYFTFNPGRKLSFTSLNKKNNILEYKDYTKKLLELHYKNIINSINLKKLSIYFYTSIYKENKNLLIHKMLVLNKPLDLIDTFDIFSILKFTVKIDIEILYRHTITLSRGD